MCKIHSGEDGASHRNERRGARRGRSGGVKDVASLIPQEHARQQRV